ncbi:MAG: PqqD family protein [Clostridia bacterium]|nr:PqqD family protein [Clostridia bacterium]
MKLKNDFILRKIPGMNLVIPAGENIRSYKGALVLNDTAAFIYERLQQGLREDEIAERMTEKYDVTKAKAMEDIARTEALLTEAGLAEQIL